MHPILFDIPWVHLPIHNYGVAIMAGFLLGVLLGSWKARGVGQSINDSLDLSMTAMVAGVLGARIFYVLDHPNEFSGIGASINPWDLFKVWDIFEYPNPMQRLIYCIGLPLGAWLGWWFFNLLYQIYRERRQSKATPTDKKKQQDEKKEMFRPVGQPAKIMRWIMMALFSVLLARVFYVIVHRQRYDFSIINTLGGGLVLYGALILSVSVGLFFIWLKKLSLLKIIDCAAPSYALGIAIGRLGCFFNGCCWGDVAAEGSFWHRLALRFPKDSPPYHWHLQHPELYHVKADDIIYAGESLPVIPTQLISSMSMLLMFVILNWFYYRKNRRAGDVMLLLGFLYSMHRFSIEFLRDDNPLLPDGLTISQNVSALVFFVCIGIFFWVRKKFNPPGAAEYLP